MDAFIKGQMPPEIKRRLYIENILISPFVKQYQLTTFSILINNQDRKLLWIFDNILRF
jgi:hypothetical protein